MTCGMDVGPHAVYGAVNSEGGGVDRFRADDNFAGFIDEDEV